MKPTSRAIARVRPLDRGHAPTLCTRAAATRRSPRTPLAPMRVPPLPGHRTRPAVQEWWRRHVMTASRPAAEGEKEGRPGPLLLDGLSWAVAHELLRDLRRQGWQEQTWLPSGDAAAERAGFAAHPGRATACDRKHPPVVFHKAAVAAAGGSCTTTGARLRSPRRPVQWEWW
jgi:hypothetical protein